MQPGAPGIEAVIVGIVLGGTLGVLWVIALVDVRQRKEWEFPLLESGASTRTMWLFIVLFMNVVGAVAYYFVVMKQYPRERP